MPDKRSCLAHCSAANVRYNEPNPDHTHFTLLATREPPPCQSEKMGQAGGNDRRHSLMRTDRHTQRALKERGRPPRSACSPSVFCQFKINLEPSTRPSNADCDLGEVPSIVSKQFDSATLPPRPLPYPLVSRRAHLNLKTQPDQLSRLARLILPCGSSPPQTAAEGLEPQGGRALWGFCGGWKGGGGERTPKRKWVFKLTLCRKEQVGATQRQLAFCCGLGVRCDSETGRGGGMRNWARHAESHRVY